MTTWVTLHMYTETHSETCPPLLSHAQVGVEPNKGGGSGDAASNITVTAMIQFQLEMGELVSKVANVIMEYMWDKRGCRVHLHMASLAVTCGWGSCKGG